MTQCLFARQLKPLVQKALLGFTSGVMVAASVWSLIPAMDMSDSLGKLAFIRSCWFAQIAFTVNDRSDCSPFAYGGGKEAGGPKTL